MQNAVEIQLQLPKPVAEALLTSLRLCCQLAALREHNLFAFWLDALLTDPSREIRQADAYRLMGMLAAYLEQDQIDTTQLNAMSAELRAFAFGATV